MNKYVDRFVLLHNIINLLMLISALPSLPPPY